MFSKTPLCRESFAGPSIFPLSYNSFPASKLIGIYSGMAGVFAAISSAKRGSLRRVLNSLSL